MRYKTLCSEKKRSEKSHVMLRRKKTSLFTPHYMIFLRITQNCFLNSKSSQYNTFYMINRQHLLFLIWTILLQDTFHIATAVNFRSKIPLVLTTFISHRLRRRIFIPKNNLYSAENFLQTIIRETMCRNKILYVIIAVNRN